MFLRLLSLTTLVFLAACGAESPPATTAEVETETGAPAESAPMPEAAKAELGDWGVETQYVDRGITPGDDFHRYVNAGWLETAEYPPGEVRFSSFTAVGLDVDRQIKSIVDEALAGDWPPGSPEANIKAVYESFMDTATRDQLGVEPLRPDLDAIFAASTPRTSRVS